MINALREIDQSLASPTGSFDGIYDWSLGSGDSSPTTIAEGDDILPPDVAFLSLGVTSSYPPAEAMLTTATPLASPQYSPYGPNGLPGITSNPSTPEKGPFPFSGYPGVRLPSESFIPYVDLFFEHMYPIMPVLDRKYYIESGILSSHTALPSDQYLLLCALSAMTIVQLEAAPQVPNINGNPGDSEAAAEIFAKECLRERRNTEYVEDPTDLTVLTSFFLFCYYGNLEKSEKAWYYLQESLSFSQIIELDSEAKVAALEHMESQWRRRLFWLLFVTEKYASRDIAKKGQLKICQGLCYPTTQTNSITAINLSPCGLSA